MRCPKCQFDHQLQTTECLKCGIIFSRYQAAVETAAKMEAAAVPVVGSSGEARAMAGVATAIAAIDTADDGIAFDARKELTYRIFALPLAMLVAWFVARTPLRLVSGILTMVLHESGHAISAWLTGRWAIPALWMTPHGEERSWVIVVGLAAAIVLVGFLAWRAERWKWVLAAGAMLLLQITFLSLPWGATIVFCGDGGALVLATILMAAFYAPPESRIYRSWGLRWGLLVIGALSFVYVFILWSGPYENIPFGEVEGVNLSDPSLLTDLYGWPVTALVDRYNRLAHICLAALLAVYVWGLFSAYREMRRTRLA